MRDSVIKLPSTHADAQSGDVFVVEVVAGGDDHSFIRGPVRGTESPALRRANRRVAVVHRALRQLAEAIAEGRGKAPAEALRRTKTPNYG